MATQVYCYPGFHPIYDLYDGGEIYQPVTTPYQTADWITDEYPTAFLIHTSGVFKTPHYVTAARSTSNTYDVGDPLYLCGSLVTMQAAFQANVPSVLPQQPLGPMTMMFKDDQGTPAFSTQSDITFMESNTYKFAFDPADPDPNELKRVLITYLNSDGTDLDGPYTLNDAEVYPYTAMPHYGFRLEHEFPGDYAPASFGIYGMELTLEADPIVSSGSASSPNVRSHFRGVGR